MSPQEIKSKGRNARKNRTNLELKGDPDRSTKIDNGKRQLIITKAITLFANSGYDNVKISDITSSIGIAKGTLYLYFKTKKDLFIECFGELNRLLQTLETLDEIHNEKDFYLRNRNRWVRFAERYSDFGGILNALRTACGSNDIEIRTKARETYDVIIEPLRRDIVNAIENGSDPDLDPELISHYFLGASESLAFRLYIDKRYTINDISEVIKNLCRKVMTPNRSGVDSEKRDDDAIGKITDKCGTSNGVSPSQ